jgi:hypothetical protein
MKNKININGYDISKTQIDATEYTITAFHSEKFEFQFNVSLLPKGKDNLLPAYQLTEKSHTIPAWVKDNLDTISDWIIKETK